MKSFPQVVLASVAFLVPFVAASRPAQAGGWACALQAGGHVSIEEFAVNTAFDQALDVARKGGDCRLGVIELDGALRLENLSWFGAADQCLIQELLDAEIADLFERAKVFRVHEAEMRQMQFEIVMARYERIATSIAARWKQGQLAEDLLEKALMTLEIEAFGHLSSAGFTDIRAQLQEAVTRLIERGNDAMDRADALYEFYVKTYTVRLEASLAVLKDRIASSNATKQDLFRLNQVVAALDYLATHPKPHPCGS